MMKPFQKNYVDFLYLLRIHSLLRHMHRGVNNPLKMHKTEINIIVMRNFIFITFYIVLSVFFLTGFLLRLKSVMRTSNHIYAQ